MTRLERIGRYELVRPLDAGARGTRHLARATGPGRFERHVVIEILDGTDTASFLDEARLAGLLHHQHIASVFEVNRDGDRLYLAREYCHGRSARDVWHQTFTMGALLPVDFALTAIAAAASGLHYAHTRRSTDDSPLGIVHGDVSLSNLLIGFDGSVQLVGFATRGAETEFAKGRVAYLSPEQARRQALDPRSDVFALGILLYELTTMRPAFRDTSDRLTLERIKSGAYAQPRSIIADYPVELERIIARALRVDPSERYPDAEALQRDLDALGHRLELVLGDAAIVEVMAQLFEDRREPWRYDGRPSAPRAEPPPVGTETPPLGQRRLRAATETVDALSIDLEIPDGVFGDHDVTTPESARVATSPVPAIRDVPPGLAPPVDPRAVSAIADLLEPEPPSRETLPGLTPVRARVAGEPEASPAAANDTDGVAAIPGPSARVTNDTEGVPVIPVPVSMGAPAQPPEPVRRPRAVRAEPVPGSPDRRRRVAVIAGAGLAAGGLAVVGYLLLAPDAPAATTVGPGSGEARVVLDAPAARPGDAPAVVGVPGDAGAVAVVVDARTTILLRITSDPPDATLELDSTRLGKTPYEGTVDIAEGSHTLKLRMRGYATARIPVELTTDLTQDVTLRRMKVEPDAGAVEEPTPSASQLQLPE